MENYFLTNGEKVTVGDVIEKIEKLFDYENYINGLKAKLDKAEKEFPFLVACVFRCCI